MVSLGLRVGEVAGLKLEDIDWREGTIRVVKTKARKMRILPLPKDVGEALVDYLINARPQTNERYVFIHRRSRRGTNYMFATSRDAIRTDINRAFKRGGIGTHAKGSRILRHTAATNLIQGGATLKEIADILGHSSIDTTAIYTKVDLPTLREVALPWPGVK